MPGEIGVSVGGELMNRVAILGAGGMGTALALLFERAVGDVRLWSRDRAHAEELLRHADQQRHLPGVVLPDGVLVTSRAAEAAAGADLMVAAVPTAYLRTTLEALAEELPAETAVLSVVKGIEYGTFARPSQIIEQTLGRRPIAVLSGPSHAEELARGLPASVVVSGKSESLNDRVRDVLSHEAFRVYTSTDPLGVSSPARSRISGNRRGHLRRARGRG